MHVSEDARLVSARAIPATESSRKAAAVTLECGRSTDGLPLLRIELARGAAGSKLPPKQSGSKLGHSKKDVKFNGTN
jgi:hypothetical protein